MTTTRQIRPEKIAAGYCGGCGCRKVKPGCKRCVVCLRGKAKTRMRLIAWRILDDECIDCGRPAPNYVRCDRCRKRNRDRTREAARFARAASMASHRAARKRPQGGPAAG